MEVTKKLAEFIVNTDLSSIPPEAREIGKRAVLDLLGVALAGSRDPMARILTDFIKESGSRAQASVWGKKFKASPAFAALANGTFGHALDYVDINRNMRGHPSVPVVPATLAVAEEVKASGEEVLAAFLIGFEVR